MKTHKKLLISDNDIVSGLLHKKERTDIEEALFVLWYDFMGYEYLVVKALKKLKELTDERDMYKNALDEEMGTK